MQRWRWLVLVGLCVVATVPGRAAQAQQARRWLADPELLTDEKVIGADGRQLRQSADGVRDIALLDQTTGWAVSYRGLLRFDGRWWRPAQPLGNRDSLSALAFNNATSGWAVGSSYADSAPPTVLIMRFDGVEWRGDMVSVDRNGTSTLVRGYLRDVAAFADGTAIAIGSTYDWENPDPTRRAVEHPLVLRFDGMRWRDETPASEGRGRLTTLSMTSATEGWAAGSRGTNFDEETLMLHLRGSVWTEEAIPNSFVPQNPSRIDVVVMRDASEG